MSNNTSGEAIGIPLCISFFAYILLWCTAMEFIAVIDSSIVFSMVLFASYGAYRGGIRTLLSFVGAILSFLLALYGYDKLYSQLESKSDVTPLWGQFTCFLIILLGAWILWYIFSRILLVWQRIDKTNPIAGTIIGIGEGVVILGLCLTVLSSSKVLETQYEAEMELEKSWIMKYVQVISPREYFDKIDLLVRFQKFHLNKKIQLVSESIANGDKRLECQILELLLSFAQNPSSMEKCWKHPEFQKAWDKLLQIPEMQKHWQDNEHLQKFKQKTKWNIMELCSLLQKPWARQLAKNTNVNQIFQSINFEKIKSGI